MYQIIKALVVLVTGVFVKDAMARDRDFDPMTGMEVLTHGETKIASFPTGTTCCSVAAINVPNSLKEYEEGPFSELHVTTVGSSYYTAQDGEKGLYTETYSKINRPNSYSKFAFDVEGHFSSVCDLVVSGLTTRNLKLSVATSTDKDNIDRLKSELHENNVKSGTKEAAFTFFGPRINPRETAVIRCWPLEDDVLVGALLKSEETSTLLGSLFR